MSTLYKSRNQEVKASTPAVAAKKLAVKIYGKNKSVGKDFKLEIETKSSGRKSSYEIKITPHAKDKSKFTVKAKRLAKSKAPAKTKTKPKKRKATTKKSTSSAKKKKTSAAGKSSSKATSKSGAARSSVTVNLNKGGGGGSRRGSKRPRPASGGGVSSTGGSGGGATVHIQQALPRARPAPGPPVPVAPVPEAPVPEAPVPAASVPVPVVPRAGSPRRIDFRTPTRGVGLSFGPQTPGPGFVSAVVSPQTPGPGFVPAVVRGGDGGDEDEKIDDADDDDDDDDDDADDADDDDDDADASLERRLAELKRDLPGDVDGDSRMVGASALEDRNIELEGKLSELKKQFTHAAESRGRLEAELKQANLEASFARKNLEQNTLLNDSLTKQLTTSSIAAQNNLNKLNQELRDNKIKNMKSLSNLEDKIDNIISQRNALKQKIAEETKKSIELQSKFDKEKKAHGISLTLGKEVAKVLEERKEKITTLEAEIAKAKVKVKKDPNKEDSGRIDKMQKTLEGLREEAKKSEKDLAQSELDVKERDGSLAQAAQELKRVQGANQTMQAKGLELEETSLQQISKINELSGQLRTGSAELARINAQLEAETKKSQNTRQLTSDLESYKEMWGLILQGPIGEAVSAAAEGREGISARELRDVISISNKMARENAVLLDQLHQNGFNREDAGPLMENGIEFARLTQKIKDEEEAELKANNVVEENKQNLQQAIQGGPDRLRLPAPSIAPPNRARLALPAPELKTKVALEDKVIALGDQFASEAKTNLEDRALQSMINPNQFTPLDPIDSTFDLNARPIVRFPRIRLDPEAQSKQAVEDRRTSARAAAKVAREKKVLEMREQKIRERRRETESDVELDPRDEAMAFVEKAASPSAVPIFSDPNESAFPVLTSDAPNIEGVRRRADSEMVDEKSVVSSDAEDRLRHANIIAERRSMENAINSVAGRSVRPIEQFPSIMSDAPIEVLRHRARSDAIDIKSAFAEDRSDRAAFEAQKHAPGLSGVSTEPSTPDQSPVSSDQIMNPFSLADRLVVDFDTDDESEPETFV